MVDYSLSMPLHRENLLKILPNSFRNNDDLSEQSFFECRIFIIPHPKAKFTEEEASISNLPLEFESHFSDHSSQNNFISFSHSER